MRVNSVAFLFTAMSIISVTIETTTAKTSTTNRAGSV